MLRDHLHTNEQTSCSDGDSATRLTTFERGEPANTDSLQNSCKAIWELVGKCFSCLRHLPGEVLRLLATFISKAVKEDWSAFPIAFASSMFATYLTALGVDALVPWFERELGGAHTAGFVLATSTAAVILGYAGYVLLYWSGMLWKERSNLFDTDGKLCPERCRKTWRVFKIDFLMHLPSDIWWVFGMFSAQGGLYVTGASSLFWSIICSQALSDVYYSLREPFYWQASKMLATRFDRNAGELVPANSADFGDGGDDQVVVNS